MKVRKRDINKHIITILAVLLAVLWLIPFIWLVGTAFTKASYNMTLFPTTPFTFENFKYVWNAVPFGRYYINTLILVVVTFSVQFVTSTLAAYALAVLPVKGKAIVYVIIFMQIIIPNDVLIMPNYMTIADLGLTDTKLGIMLPFLEVHWKYSY